MARVSRFIAWTEGFMDATRTRRTRDGARRAGYAPHPQGRGARRLGVVGGGKVLCLAHAAVGDRIFTMPARYVPGSPTRLVPREDEGQQVGGRLGSYPGADRAR